MNVKTLDVDNQQSRMVMQMNCEYLISEAVGIVIHLIMYIFAFVFKLIADVR